MPIIKVALLGLGTVGTGVYEVILNQQAQLKRLIGADVQVAAVLIQDADKTREVGNDVLVTNNIDEILAIPGLDVIFESIVGEEPANHYIDAAIEQGCHIITANKEMFAKHGETLLEKAAENNVRIGFEATVAAGVPIIRTIEQQLQLNQIERVQALLNGTSNFILTEMRKKQLPFNEVLKTAQSLGFAEADPTNDVEGWDAFYKIMILSQLIYGEQPDWETVKLQGIASVQAEDVYRSDDRYRHIAELTKIGDHIQASVRPVTVNDQHPLFSVEGVNNAVVLETSLAGQIMIQGPGAGSKPTASAMLEDFIHIFQTHPAAVFN